MNNIGSSKVKTLIWEGTILKLIDQRKLPFEELYIDCRTAKDAADAIKDMIVRGAPAIGVTAAYGVALGAIEFQSGDRKKFFDFLDSVIKLLSESRPTAVNLYWALERMKNVIDKNRNREILEIKEKLITEAAQIEKEDRNINHMLGKNSLQLFEKSEKRLNALTHCNAGALATAGYGTALGVIRSLYASGKIEHVIVDETRPYLQGARLTAWELYQEGIPFFIITDNMSGYFMSTGKVDVVIVGADRIAANGDTANKIGTLTLSVLAKFYDIPFYVAAPLSTIDLKTENGASIPIEQRGQEEVRMMLGRTIIPDYMPVLNPAFDVSPNENISAIITEAGIIFPPYRDNIKNIFKHN